MPYFVLPHPFTFSHINDSDLEVTWNNTRNISTSIMYMPIHFVQLYFNEVAFLDYWLDGLSVLKFHKQSKRLIFSLENSGFILLSYLLSSVMPTEARTGRVLLEGLSTLRLLSAVMNDPCWEEHRHKINCVIRRSYLYHGIHDQLFYIISRTFPVFSSWCYKLTFPYIALME